MKYIIIVVLLGIMILFIACGSPLETANLDNSRVIIDGKTYKVELVEDKSIIPMISDNLSISAEPQSELLGYDSLPLDNVKYYITDSEGNIYATRYELINTGKEVITITHYFIKEKNTERWFWHEEGIELSQTKVTIEQVR
jgi:hypothetical protein